MRQILLFAALATSLALLSGCTLSKTKADTAEDMTDKAAYHKLSAEEAYEMMASQEVVVLIYCRSGRRSKDAAEKLLALGYQSVYDFGGVIDWPYELVKEE